MIQKIILFILFIPSLSLAARDVQIFCTVNRSLGTTIYCGDGWIEMETYPHIEIKLQSCMNFRSQQGVKIRINGVIYDVSKENGYTLKKNTFINVNIDGYDIKCVEL